MRHRLSKCRAHANTRAPAGKRSLAFTANSKAATTDTGNLNAFLMTVPSVLNVTSAFSRAFLTMSWFANFMAWSKPNLASNNDSSPPRALRKGRHRTLSDHFMYSVISMTAAGHTWPYSHSSHLDLAAHALTLVWIVPGLVLPINDDSASSGSPQPTAPGTAGTAAVRNMPTARLTHFVRSFSSSSCRLPAPPLVAHWTF